ncbi:DNA-binding transcriptional regulator, ArsR family [Microlunatus flavus]|uniref:DNA-binding transcriptional regulator, ArsR family n=1 Tax=Microlunatus flavus TaxID=1036181 RepID=A0A1H8ZHB8_9ACTN|nr:DNA-binding transcriptional regulator, ArsR family [Microlunatus flavus]
MYRPTVLISSPTDALARFGHALSDPTRARVLLTLRDGPAYPADLADRIGVSRQAMSNHLGCLRGCGLVVARPDGRRTRYELTDARLGHALDDLLDVVLVVDPACCGGEDADGATASSADGVMVSTASAPTEGVRV